MNVCPHCGVIEGTSPHDRSCPVFATGCEASTALSRAREHLQRADTAASAGRWDDMNSAITDAHIEMADARKVADDWRD